MGISSGIFKQFISCIVCNCSWLGLINVYKFLLKFPSTKSLQQLELSVAVQVVPIT
jgi:hypothetical protein